jgi:acetylornithine/succinyldiaminopimelate/putrescine aminotransferase/predicted amino acid dehydrogenase
MADAGLDQLTAEQKRALLAERLRQRSVIATTARSSSNGAAPPHHEPHEESRKSFLDRDVVALSSLKDWRAEDQDPYTKHVAPYKGFLYQRLGMDKTFVRGEGCYLFDAEGTGYADCIAQFGAVPLGHDPEPIWQALDSVRRQAVPNLVITSIPAAQGELAARLLEIAPPGFEHVVFTNSGAESVEAALKIARCRTGRLGILSTRNSFHGLTLAGMSATDTAFFQRGFGAPVPGFELVPFGDLRALEAALAARPDFFAAFMLEIIQGESGIRVAPPGYLAAARDLCRRYGALLIVDEVQTGLGRTGTLFACEAEGVTPDIVALAKALGGGLMPIGACLYTRDAYTEQFDLRHGSTFAGNTLACRAALATINELTKDDRRLVRHVAAIGARLLGQLRDLQTEYPTLVKEIRGRGLMLGVELDLEQVARHRNSLLALLQDQGLLLYTVVSYLLNVERIRLAPSFTHGHVVRIEPPLIADTALCDHVIGALRRLLDALQRGDSGQLLGHLMGRSDFRAPSRSSPPEPDALSRPAIAARPPRKRTRFAFIAHMLSMNDFRRFDPSLGPFDDMELERLKSRVADFMRMCPINELTIESADGRLAEGELIVLPQMPSDLLALSQDEAVDRIQSAVDLSVERGAEVIGLAGFSSIITYGGLALQARDDVRVTSGNSYTTWSAMRAVEAACAKHGVSLANCTVAIVGATGAIGQALSLLCAERAAKLILIGNPRAAETNIGRLQLVAEDCRRHVAARSAAGRKFHPDTVAERFVRRPTMAATDAKAGVTTTTDIESHLPQAHIILTATSAVQPFISGRHLQNGAMVCDVSRPFNVTADLGTERPDVRWVDGGLVRAPDASVLGLLEEPERRNVLVACAAETIILALSGFRSDHLCGRLDPATIEELGSVAARMGFSAAS